MFNPFAKKIDLEAFMSASIEGLQLATTAHAQTWHLGSEKTWNVDQGNGTLQFSFEDGVFASAPAQIIGTYNAQDGTFMWGWDHPSVRPGMQAHAKKVQVWGRQHRFPEFRTAILECTQERAWGYTAIAMRLAQATGAFRAPANPSTFVFMTFGTVNLQKDDSPRV